MASANKEFVKLKGYYNNEQHVVVRGSEQIQKLQELGYYGTDLETARRKDDTRRGPLDRVLIKATENISDDARIALLTIHEAMYLVHALNCLDIESSEGEKLNLPQCWHSFRSFCQSANAASSFMMEYLVYYHLRAQGWVVKQGDNYGVNFLLYKNGPSIDHSSYAVLIMSDTSGAPRSYDWTSIATFQRVTQSVKKELLLVYVSDMIRANLDCGDPNWVGGQNLLIKKLIRHTSLITQ